MFPYPRPCINILAHAYAHRKSWRSTGRKCNMAMGRPPNPAKTQCFPTLDPASYILAHAYAHRKSRGSTDRKCNMAMGRLPNPAKTCQNTVFPYPRPCIFFPFPLIFSHVFSCPFIFSHFVSFPFIFSHVVFHFVFFSLEKT